MIIDSQKRRETRPRYHHATHHGITFELAAAEKERKLTLAAKNQALILWCYTVYSTYGVKAIDITVFHCLFYAEC